jgi:transcriptional regulator with XRE-family HTH domain
MDLMKPSAVFGERLQAMRDSRGFKQAKLAQLATEAGRDLDRAAVLRIEKGQRGLALDEAIALTRVLHAVPAQMLTPPEGRLTALTENEGVDGAGLRNWLMYGEPILGLTIAIDDEGNEPPDVLRGRLERELVHHALALTDAVNGKDQAGIRAAGESILNAVDTYQKAISRKEEANG